MVQVQMARRTASSGRANQTTGSCPLTPGRMAVLRGCGERGVLVRGWQACGPQRGRQAGRMGGVNQGREGLEDHRRKARLRWAAGAV